MTDPNPDSEEVLTDFCVTYARTARFTLGAPRNVSVTGDGEHVLFLRSRSADDPVLGLWSVEVQTQTERLIVDPADLGADDQELPAAERARRERARESAAGIVGYSLDREGRAACFALGGALFVVDVATGAIISADLGGSVFDPRFDPTGSRIAYVDGQDLRIVDVAEGLTNDRVLAAEADPLISCGRAEFIAGEEMSRSRGYWWAPDGDALLMAVVDETPIQRWWIADPANPDREPNEVRYPAAGTANAQVRLDHVTLDGARRPIHWNEHGRYEYLADVVWSAAGQPLVVRQTRDQRTVSIAAINLDQLVKPHGSDSSDQTDQAEQLTEIHAITDETWVELMPGSPRWSAAGLLTIEDRANHRSLCLDGAILETGSLHIRSIVGVIGTDGADRFVIVSAWSEPTEIHLYAIALGPDQASQPIALTTQPGVHAGVVRGSVVVITSSSPERAGSTTSVHRFEGDRPGLSAPQAALRDLSADPGFSAAPLFLTLGPDQLESALFLPTNHNGRDPLPVLLDPYGGPHAQRVLKTHNPHLVSRWFAEQGYAVLVTDGRGTPGRGPKWEREVWGDLATPVLNDQLAALDAALDRYQFLDRDRVGIRGWSFGGYLAALAVLQRPDRFHAALAGAPVTTWRLYDTHYTERYLGHPAEHRDHYDTSDLWVETEQGPQIKDLERPLLLIHGLADDNVVAAHTLRLSTALLATGSAHRVLPLSGVTHMTPQLAVAENLLRLQLKFLDDVLR